MAKGSLGEYSVAVTGDTKNFEYAIQQSIETSNKFAVSIRKTSTEVQIAASGFKNGTFAIQQLALGVQDAASVFVTAGFSGAIRAAGNNVIQFASLLTPLAGTIAAVGITGLQMLADYFKKSGEAATKAAEEFKNFRYEVDKNTEAAKMRKEVSTINKETSVKGIEGKILDTKEQRDNELQQMKDNAESIEQQQRLIERAQDRVRSRVERDRRVAIEQRKEGQFDPKAAALGYMNPAEKEIVRQAELQIGKLRDKNIEIDKSASENAKRLEESYKKRSELQMKESIDADLKAFGGGDNAAMDERKRKKAVDFENTRQKLIADNNRDMFAEEEAHRQRMARFNPFAGAAGYGSQQATEAISRAQAVPNDLVDIDKQVLSVQQKALSELSEIRLNTKPQKVEVVETFE